MDEVRDHDVGVQLRVARTRCPVPERRGDEPVTGDLLNAGLPSPGAGSLRFERCEGAGDGDIVRSANLLGDLRVTEREQQRDRLRGAERGVEPRDLRRTLPTRQRLARPGIASEENMMERLRVDLSFEPETPRGAPDPLPGSLLRSRVVLLRATSDGVEVVLLLTGSELAETQHPRDSHPHAWDVPPIAWDSPSRRVGLPPRSGGTSHAIAPRLPALQVQVRQMSHEASSRQNVAWDSYSKGRDV